VTGQNRTPNSQVMFGATTKKTFLIERPEQASDLFEEAVNLAYEGRPGPVHIDLPYDVAAAETRFHREISVQVKPVLPLEKDLRVFAEYLDQSLRGGKKVIAYFGFGCVQSGAGPELLEFVERFQIPFITTMDAKGVIPDNHPLSLGMGGSCGDPGARQALKEGEVVLAVGCSFAKWQTWRFQEDIFDNKVLMHINLDPHEIGKVFKADFSMISDAKPGMAGLTRALASRITVSEKARPVIDRYCFRPVAYDGPKVHPGQLSREMGRLMPDKAIVLGDAGAHMVWMASHMQLNGGQCYKNPGSFGPMASHTNAAIGVQLAAPDRRVVVGCGDGCYQMAGFELMTAVQNRIPIIWVVFNNGEFNIIKLFNLVAHGKEVFNHILGPDFAEYAKICGANGHRVDRIEAFEPAFRAALASDMPTVIDVRVDESCVMPFKFYNEE
jgi:acetolactate synthase-1/2/3 large subunit